MAFRNRSIGSAMFGPMKKAKIVLGALFGLVLATASAEAQELKLGANIGNVPWEFQNAKGEFVGFEIDLATEIGNRLGYKIRVVNIPFNGLFAAVESGQIDMAVSSMTITAKRLQAVSFAQPYYDSDQSLSVRTASGIKNLAGIAGKSIGVDTGSTGDVWTTQNKDKYKIADIRRYEGLSPAMLDLAAGRIDGYISDFPAVQYYLRDKPAYRVIERIPAGGQYSIMFAKNSPLAAKADATITQLKNEGYIAALHKKWFGVAAGANSSTVKPAMMPKL
jgi:polar amino acid transport system substrate-binding protein